MVTENELRPAFSAAGQPEVWYRYPLDVDEAANHIERARLMVSGEQPLPALRWYWTVRPSLVLGVFQSPETISEAAAAELGVPIVHRRSGGTAVLADPPLLSVDIALPVGHPLALADVTESYRWIGQLWLDTLEELGLQGARLVSIEEVRANPSRPPRRKLVDGPLTDDDLSGLSCYATLSPYEVAVGRRKVVGLCQVRRRTGVLYQIGLPLSWDGALLARLLARREEDYPRLLRLLDERCTGLDQLLANPPSPEQVMEVFEWLLAERHGVVLRPA